EAELRGGGLGGEQRRGGAVRQPGGVACRDAAARPERRAKGGAGGEWRGGPEELVPLGDLPPIVGEDAHRHDRAREDAVRLGPRRGGPPPRLGGGAGGRPPRPPAASVL